MTSLLMIATGIIFGACAAGAAVADHIMPRIKIVQKLMEELADDELEELK